LKVARGVRGFAHLEEKHTFVWILKAKEMNALKLKTPVLRPAEETAQGEQVLVFSDKLRADIGTALQQIDGGAFITSTDLDKEVKTWPKQ
jgi:hypothetical protein